MEQTLSYTNDLLQWIPDQIEVQLKAENLDIEGEQRAAQLLKFCRDGNVSQVKAMGLIYSLLEVKTANFFGFTPLHWAVFGGHVELTEYLLRQGADIVKLASGSEEYPYTKFAAPLHLLALLGRSELWQTLQSYVDMNQCWDALISPYLDSPSHLLVTSDHFSELLFRALRSKRAHSLTDRASHINRLGEGLLHRAAATRNIESLEFLLRECEKHQRCYCPDSARFETEWDLGKYWVSFDSCHRSVVWHAAASGFADGIHLMHQSLDLTLSYMEEPDNTGVSPMHIACRQGHDKVVEVLLSLGAKADGKAKLGLTPAHFAAFFGHSACLQKMADHGVEMDSPSISLHGLRPLHLAALRGRMRCVEVLKMAGVNQFSLGFAVFRTDKEWWDDEGHVDDMQWTELDFPWTPMEMAIWNGHLLVAELVEHERRSSPLGYNSMPPELPA